MNRTDLIAKAASDAGMSKADMTRALDAILGTVQTAVASGEKVTIPGVVSFERTFRKGGERRNPGSGETVTVADKYVPTVKVAKGFKDVVAAAA